MKVTAPNNLVELLRQRRSSRQRLWGCLDDAIDVRLDRSVEALDGSAEIARDFSTSAFGSFSTASLGRTQTLLCTMKRRECLFTLASLPLSGSASAGMLDWYNGVKIGSTLPEFDAEYLGELPSPNRKLLLVDFWATWCAPCREEFPHLNELHTRFKDHGLVVVGLTEETKAIAQAFLPRVSIRYPIGAGGLRPLQKALGIKGLPYAVLADSKNSIIWRGQANTLTPTGVEARLRAA